jgi:hypothetical protein
LYEQDSGRWAVSRSLSGDDASSRENEAKTLLNSLLPALIRASNKQLKGPSLKTKSVSQSITLENTTPLILT